MTGGGGCTVNTSVALALPLIFAAPIVTLLVPVAVAVPLITPLLALMVSPDGNPLAL